MKYLKFTHVDAITGISVAAEPSLNGAVFPDVEGLAFVWARESAYPTATPDLFGTCPDTSSVQVDGVLGVFCEADWLQMQLDEMNARDKRPKSVTMRQARRALLDAGLLGQVTTVINAMPSPQKEAAQIEWEYAGTVARQGVLTDALGASLSLDDAAIDALFETASKL